MAVVLALPVETAYAAAKTLAGQLDTGVERNARRLSLISPGASADHHTPCANRFPRRAIHAERDRSPPDAYTRPTHAYAHPALARPLGTGRRPAGWIHPGRRHRPNRS
jgi:hypothetical protein